jgi:hypothetical protein
MTTNYDSATTTPLLSLLSLLPPLLPSTTTSFCPAATFPVRGDPRLRSPGLGARGSGLRAQGSGLRARGSGLGAQGSGLRDAGYCTE